MEPECVCIRLELNGWIHVVTSNPCSLPDALVWIWASVLTCKPLMNVQHEHCVCNQQSPYVKPKGSNGLPRIMHSSSRDFQNIIKSERVVSESAALESLVIKHIADVREHEHGYRKILPARTTSVCLLCASQCKYGGNATMKLEQNPAGKHVRLSEHMLL